MGRVSFSTISAVEAIARAVRQELLYMAPSVWRSDGFSGNNFFCFALAVCFWYSGSLGSKLNSDTEMDAESMQLLI